MTFAHSVRESLAHHHFLLLSLSLSEHHISSHTSLSFPRRHLMR